LQKKNIEIFLVSFTILFLEIVLIRWVSTEIRIFAYLSNLVLLSCFLGIGLGCYFSEKRCSVSRTILFLALLLFLVNFPLFIDLTGERVHLFRDLPILLSGFNDSVIWYEIEKPLILGYLGGLTATMFIFILILLIFIPLGQILGRVLARHENIILAYSINILASLLGIWFFNLFSFFYTPPAIWFVFVLVIVTLFMPPSRSNFLSLFICLIVIFFTMIFPLTKPTANETIWSPYQKLEISPLKRGGYVLRVNNVGYMTLLDLSDEGIRKLIGHFDQKMRKFSQYDLPYLFFKKDIEDVLIVGAGAGNDVSGALRNGVRNVEAVEIDPGIYKLGKKYHPEFPYAVSRVKVIIDDARSFFKKSKKKFDIISFGTLDAHTLAFNYNNMRIDHYVYTEESLREAKNLLKEDGILSLIFDVKRPWIGQRIQGLLNKVFGYPPLVFRIKSAELFGWEGVTFIAGKERNKLFERLGNNPELKHYIENILIDYSGEVKLTTDDWPYLYLEKPMIPMMHLWIILILVLLFFVTRSFLLPKGQKLNLHFFTLGTAFLLLEFQNISKTTLLFGSTWIVNTFTISAILFLILLANLFVHFFKPPRIKIIYLLLFSSILFVYFIPLEVFNFLSYWPRSILSSIVLNLPIFFAGIVFIDSFKNTQLKNLAYGSNLLGATVGGILESASFIFGVNMLLVIVAGFYLVSYILLRIEFNR